MEAASWKLSEEECKRAAYMTQQCLNFEFDKDEGELVTRIAAEDFLWLLEKATELTLLQPTLLRLTAPIQVVGDIHGQYLDLLRIFEAGGYPPQVNYLFLGDYVDRGKNGLECVCLLLSLKVRFPNSIFLLRGNHECESINRAYGFLAECKKKYDVELWKKHLEYFDSLPLAAVIEEKVFCIHGGISPLLENLSDIEEIKRPLQVQTKGMIVDFLWSDPDADVRGWAESDRGISYCFGADTLNQFLQKNGFELFIRAHQVVEKGYEFFADRRLVTLFSAPNYCGEFDNAGAILSLKYKSNSEGEEEKLEEEEGKEEGKDEKQDKDNGHSYLECSFIVLGPNLKNGFAYSYAGRPTTPLLD